MKIMRRITVIAILSLLLIGCNGGTSEKSEAKASGETAATGVYPSMGVADLDAFLADNKGQPTMLLFWTTWCPSCKEELPEMAALAKSHGDKVNIITVSLDENVAALDAFFAKKSLDVPVYHGDNAMARKFGVEAIPTLLMFDRSGELVFNKPGVFPHAMLVKMAEKLAEQ